MFFAENSVYKGITVPKQVVTKDKICISIDKELHSRLKKHSDENLMKLSTYLEYLIKKGEEHDKKK